MRATIFAIQVETESDDLVLSTAQIVQTIRASLPAAQAPNGHARPAPAQIAAPPPAAPAAEVSPDPLPGVTIHPPADAVKSGPDVTLYDVCQDCGQPKPKTKSPRCRRCAVKRGIQRTRHNA
jgi:hypothetical protein